MEILIFILWIGFTVGAGKFASSRGHSGFVWGFFALIFSPLLSFIIVAILPNKTKDEAIREQQYREEQRHKEQLEAINRQNESKDSEYRDCPFCAEKILLKAKICKHCRSEIEPTINNKSPEESDICSVADEKVQSLIPTLGENECIACHKSNGMIMKMLKTNIGTSWQIVYEK